ncbi:hypothetical protein AB835_01540 [Candidatus Endobugula sertula]|uniref:Uncharacterized protein n=1 Tax=Candidatus Endobugula sertula TaxID=62101 RepID=A0A1D2QT56_9GAMM|nr:hypothetical protein AB835_01540 [Candidatus Endobugula sertula]
MGQLSQQELAQLIAANFPPSDDLSLQPTFTGSVGTALLNAANDTIVEADGNKTTVSSGASEAEIRNATAGLQSDNLDEQRIAVASGVQTGNQFIGTQQNEKRRLAEKKKEQQARKNDTDLLAMLQGQLADLYEERNEGLANYLSQSEIEMINELPREQQDQAIREKMQEKLENGDITQAQYDAWQAWYDDWSQKEFSKQQEIQDLKNAQTPEQVKAIADSIGAGTSASVSRSLDAPRQLIVENSVEARDDVGSVEQVNDKTDKFGIGSLSNDDLFVGAPDVKGAFDLASSNTQDAQQALTLHQEQPNIVVTPTPTIG